VNAQFNTFTLPAFHTVISQDDVIFQDIVLVAQAVQTVQVNAQQVIL
jgi:hypothetical protein